MRPSLRAIRPTAVLLFLIAALLPALAPLLADGVPSTHDGHLHLQRTAALSRLAQDGIWFSRWLPDFAYGYGMPLFNYYAPLLYAPLVAIHAAGASLMQSYKLTAGLSLVASAGAMFLLARTICGTWASLTAALVYAYAPYQLVNLYVRGALAESMAMAWAPLACFAVLRLRGCIHAKWLVVVALSYAGLVLSHNVTALLLTPCLLLLVVVLALRGERRLRFLTFAGLGIATGLGLSAWFWLPAIVERDLVQLGALIEPELFASFLLSGWPPFQMTLAYDFHRPVSDALDTPIYWPQIGLVQAILTLCAAPPALWSHGPARAVAIWCLLMVIGSVATQTAAAAPLFDIVPLLGFVQFPWRLLTVFALGSALLVGLALERGPGGRATRTAASLALIAAVAWTTTARLAPPYEYPEDRFVTAEGQLRLELADFGLGSTHGGEYLPVSSGQRNSTRLRKALSDADSSETAGQRRERRSDLEIRAYTHGPLAHEIVLDARQPDQLLLHQFYFPGWSAWIDGKSAPLRAGGPLGLIALDVPVGLHTITLRFDWTPLRVGSLAFSAVLLALTGVLAVRSVSMDLAIGRPRRARLAAAGGAAGLLLVGCVVRDGAAGRAPPVAAPLPPVALDESIVLLGAQVRESGLASRRPLAIEADWFSPLPPRRRLDVVASIQAAGAEHEAVWAQSPLVRSIEGGTLFHTQTNLRLPASFPAGPAAITLRIAGDQSRDEPVTVATVTVPARAEPASEPSAPITLVDGVSVNGFELRYDGGRVRSPLRPRQSFDVGMETTVDRRRTRDLLAVLELDGRGGVARSDVYTIGSWYLPPTAWQAGDRFQQQFRLVVPDHLESGSYAARLLVFEGGGAWSGLAPFSRFAPTPRDPPLGSADIGTVDITR